MFVKLAIQYILRELADEYPNAGNRAVPVPVRVSISIRDGLIRYVISGTDQYQSYNGKNSRILTKKTTIARSI